MADESCDGCGCGAALGCCLTIIMFVGTIAVCARIWRWGFQ